MENFPHGKAQKSSMIGPDSAIMVMHSVERICEMLTELHRPDEPSVDDSDSINPFDTIKSDKTIDVAPLTIESTVIDRLWRKEERSAFQG